ncbi:hypothetical protein EWF20_06275 [Sulfolobus sp. S-194]|uniref:hypothetical protein n=1 Tax=Sulfolobus sp. S-194 TaxID=2512240 RepID=UPI001436DF1F|nr:hypothetical protein [Sulfolobus sp. S-194]QIW23799.1 hypothetical protein EWF20_06275 [Sulfolobus sp. S-194]
MEENPPCKSYYGLRFLITLTSAIRLNREYAEKVEFLERDKRQDSYDYLKKQIDTYLKSKKSKNADDKFEVTTIVGLLEKIGRPENMPDNVNTNNYDIIHRASSYAIRRYWLYNLKEFLFSPHQQGGEGGPFEVVFKLSNIEENPRDWDGVLLVVPTDAPNYRKELKVMYNTAVLLKRRARLLFSYDLASRILLVVLPTSRFTTEYERYVEPQNQEKSNKNKKDEEFGGFGGKYYLIPVVQFIEDERGRIMQTFSLSLLLIPEIPEVGDYPENLMRDGGKIDFERVPRVPDFTTEGELSDPLRSFLGLNEKDKYIKLRDLYFYALEFIFEALSRNKKVDKKLKIKQWDLVVETVESFGFRNVQIAEYGNKSTLITDDEVLRGLNLGYKPPESWFEQLSGVIGKIMRGGKDFFFKPDYVVGYNAGFLSFLWYLNDLFSIMNIEKYELLRESKGFSIVHSWTFDYYMINAISMLKAAIHSAYNAIEQEGGESLMESENELVKELLEIYDLDFAPYFKSYFRRLRDIAGTTAEYQALKEKIDTVKENKITDTEGKKNSLIVIGEVLGIIAVPILIFSDTHNEQLTISAAVTLFVIGIGPILRMYWQNIRNRLRKLWKMLISLSLNN